MRLWQGAREVKPGKAKQHRKPPRLSSDTSQVSEHVTSHNMSPNSQVRKQQVPACEAAAHASCANCSCSQTSPNSGCKRSLLQPVGVHLRGPNTPSFPVCAKPCIRPQNLTATNTPPLAAARSKHNTEHDKCASTQSALESASMQKSR